jgi:predicted TPR repeat methyltransferase
MRADYAQIFRSPAAADKYADVVYAPDSYSAHVNARQRAFLRRLVGKAFPRRRPVQHDFACGTGRAIRLLHGLVREAHGYDTSPAMLSRARSAGVYATLHTVLEDGPTPTPSTMDGPVVVTVFRLLLNVPDPVRDRAVAFAAAALPTADAGLLVVENHGNRQSLRHLSARRHAGDPWFSELSHEQVRAVLARYGFTVVTARAFAGFPAGAYRRPWLRPVARRVDDLVARLPWLWRWGTDVLYVARRTVQ